MKAVTIIKISIATIIVLLIVAVIAIFGLYNSYLKAYDSNDKTTFEIEIPAGSTYYSIGDILYENKLIRSKTIYRIYLKLNPPATELKAGLYTVSRSMDLKTIISTLEAGGIYVNPDEITITFREGLNMRGIAKVIAQNTNNTEEDVFKLLKDKSYIDSVIDKYWFITDEIKDDEIYYPLEGYLFPNTYNFTNKDVTVEEIFGVMLDEMDKQLTPLKADLEKSKYTVHEILTLASIIELEALNASDRKNVAGVFYNRLNAYMSLGSDVTTYYAAGIDMGERLPVFDINVVASKKSAYSKMSQNELALQFYQLGFFNPQNADMTLACLEMMDFDTKDKIMQKVQDNGTMFQQLAMMSQQLMQLSAIIEQDHPELQGRLINQTAGQTMLATSQVQPNKVQQKSQTQAETSKEVANNQASPV